MVLLLDLFPRKKFAMLHILLRKIYRVFYYNHPNNFLAHNLYMPNDKEYYRQNTI